MAIDSSSTSLSFSLPPSLLRSLPPPSFSLPPSLPPSLSPFLPLFPPHIIFHFGAILHVMQEWSKVYYAASTHLVKEEKEKKLDDAAELIEQVHFTQHGTLYCTCTLFFYLQQLQLLGATAIEDKLQKVLNVHFFMHCIFLSYCSCCVLVCIVCIVCVVCAPFFGLHLFLFLSSVFLSCSVLCT